MHSDDPRDRRLVKDSWPGVSMISNPGICTVYSPLYSDGQLCFDYVSLSHLVDHGCLLNNGSFGKERCTDLLRDPTGFALLH